MPSDKMGSAIGNSRNDAAAPVNVRVAVSTPSLVKGMKTTLNSAGKTRYCQAAQ
jgi:hypothetical protein